ncbi:type VI secretion system protein ImpL [Oxalobacteraceae bacterium GrIS 1.11]
MKRLLRPPALSLLGIVLLSLLFWFKAPLFAYDGAAPFAPRAARWKAIAILLLAWVAYFTWKCLRARLAGRKAANGLGADLAPPKPHPAAAELLVLGRRMRAAQKALRKARAGRLPWYLVLGAPGSGKTTALLNAGLKFPLAPPGDGPSATRDCDWRLGEEAVLLDTAGRYTTQDSSGDVDRGAWHGLLRLLRKQRRRRPVNGVIVALSVADLLRHGDSARRAQALEIRARIKELHEQWGIVFPVYVLVTKCDLLAGFVEYFDHLSRDERAQVWGATFPLAQAQAQARDAGLKLFPGEFAALEAQLQARLFERMQQERDPARRALIYHFPQQFGAIGEGLQSFLDDAFEGSAYEEAALLRGVYFISGKQEGSPIERVMSNLATGFGLQRRNMPAQADGARAYFLARLLRDVILREASLAGAKLTLERRREWLRWGGFGLAGIALASATAGLATSYARNQAYVADVARHAAGVERLARALAPEAASPLVPLALLNAARDIPGAYRDRELTPAFLMGLGLYQGNKLGEGGTLAYRRLLRAALLPRLLARMETQLRRGGANSVEYQYELLRVYLMLGQPEHLDPEAVQAWVDFDLGAGMPETGEGERRDMAGHIAALLDPANQSEAPPQLDVGLIAQIRLNLANSAMGERVYKRLERSLQLAKLNDFDVASVSGRDVAQVLTRQSGQPLTRGIAGMYTVAGYQKFMELIEPAIAAEVKDGWVLDRREAVDTLAGAAQMKAAVQQRYFDEYIRQWDALLADVVVLPFDSLDQAARVLNSLSGSESPMRKFWQAAARQTTLEKLDTVKSGIDVASEAVKQLGDAAKKRLAAALLNGTGEPVRIAARPKHPVDAHFEALHLMLAAGAANGGELDRMLLKLKDVALYFDAANVAKAAGQPMPAADALGKLKRDADGLPAPLAALMNTIHSAGAGLSLDSERARLNALWQAGPALLCRRSIAGRYPMVRTALQEVPLDDFNDYFGPGGKVDDFFQKNLSNYVDASGAQWRWRPVNGVALGISQDVLREFQRAASIRENFFSGGKQVAMRFQLLPLEFDPAFSKVVLEIEGQTVSYAPKTALEPADFQLPGGKHSDVVRFDLAPAPLEALRTQGKWAWFRMLDRGTLQASREGERFTLSFDSEGRKLSYELRATSVNNPFRRETLEASHCLDHL